MSILHGSALARTVTYIEEDAALFRLGISIALEGYTLSGSNLGCDTIVLKLYGVIACSDSLFVVREL